MNTMRILLFGLAVLPLAGCAQGPQPAEAPPFKPVASVLDIMESLIGHMATDVFASVGTVIDEKGTHEIVPKDDEAWDEVKFAAMGLAETGNLLMFPSRAKGEADWLMFSQQLVDRSVVAAKAAEAKDAGALLDAGGQIYETCTACHMKYIPADPQ